MGWWYLARFDGTWRRYMRQSDGTYWLAGCLSACLVGSIARLLGSGLAWKKCFNTPY